METLLQKKDRLEKKLNRLEERHIKQFSQHISKESDYQESARQMRELYTELSLVCDELDDPIPVRF